ncbi:MAG: hypothetical protein ACK5O2_03535 [Microthrixaceae bacterium]
MTVAVVLLAVVVALLAILVISLLRSHADILRALEELGVSLDPDALDPDALDERAPTRPTTRGRSSATGGDPVSEAGTIDGVPTPADLLGHEASDITGVTPAGDAASIGTATGDLLVAFLSTGCMTCHRFWEAFSTGEQLDGDQLGDGTRVVVVTQGVDSESPAKVAELAPPEVSVVMSSDAWEDFGVPVAPYFALVVDGRVVGEGAAAQWSQVAALLERARGDAALNSGGTGGRDDQARSRRSVLTGNRDRIDTDLLAAGIRPGDPRLTHTSADVGLVEESDTFPDAADTNGAPGQSR